MAVIVGISATAVSLSASAGGANRPSFLILIADNTGWQDFGFDGLSIETGNHGVTGESLHAESAVAGL